MSVACCTPSFDVPQRRHHGDSNVMIRSIIVSYSRLLTGAAQSTRPPHKRCAAPRGDGRHRGAAL